MTQEHAVKRSDVFQYGQWLIVEFPDALKTLSWAVYGGGLVKAKKVAWRRANNLEINQCLDPHSFLQEKLDQDNITGAIGLLTSASLDSYTDIEKSFGPYRVRCIATVGMGNALRVGDPPTAGNQVSTINLLCQVSVPLSEGAFLEAVSIATEARTLAVLEEGVLSCHTQLPATGTGTDCIVIAAPDADNGSKYAGKHTVLGHLIGSSVADAIRLGVQRWKVNEAMQQ